MMKEFILKGEKLTKKYSKRDIIFSGVDINLTNSDIIGVIGPNGSGKSTLLKTLTGVTGLSKGKITLKIKDKEIDKNRYFNYIGFVSPYLNLYEEFFPLEHIKIFLDMKACNYDEQIAVNWLKRMNLYKDRFKLISQFSSGMKQRIKYILALITQPEIIILDEPMTNLDDDGFKVVSDIIDEHIENKGGIIIATNDKREMEFCKDFVSVT